MQETWKFIIDQESDTSDEGIIKGLVSERNKEMGIFLSYYFKKDGAVVENVSVNGDINTIVNGKGRFQVTFDLIYYNACLNIHEQNKDKMEIEFSRDGDKVVLTGPNWPERGQDEI